MLYFVYDLDDDDDDNNNNNDDDDFCCFRCLTHYEL